MIVLWQSHRAQSLVEVPEGAKDALRGEVNNYALLPSQCKCTIHTLERLSKAWLGDEVATSSLSPPWLPSPVVDETDRSCLCDLTVQTTKQKSSLEMLSVPLVSSLGTAGSPEGTLILCASALSYVTPASGGSWPCAHSAIAHTLGAPLPL